jgi:hypothetical protein
MRAAARPRLGCWRDLLRGLTARGVKTTSAPQGEETLNGGSDIASVKANVPMEPSVKTLIENLEEAAL